jgi:hypothetical protein
MCLGLGFTPAFALSDLCCVYYVYEFVMNIQCRRPLYPHFDAAKLKSVPWLFDFLTQNFVIFFITCFEFCCSSGTQGGLAAAIVHGYVYGL